MNNQEFQNPQDKGSFGWAVLGFFVPIAGLIMFLCWRENRPKDAKKAGVGALVGFICGLIVPIIISAAFYFAIWPAVQNSLVQQTCNTYGSDYKAVRNDSDYENRWCCCKDGISTCHGNDGSCIVVSGEEAVE